MKARRTPKPLDEAALQQLAVHYVGRYATTCAKLATYLRRKVQERGWAGDRPPEIEAVVARCVEAGFVDDAAFAEARSATLTRRGYGARRIGQALAHAGIAPDLAASLQHDEDEAFAAAARFAGRKRFGPFADRALDDAARHRAFGAMVRAGHSFALARHFTEVAPSDPE